MTFQSRVEVDAGIEHKEQLRPAVSPRLLLLVIAIATLAAALLRIAGIGTRSLWLDEAYSGWFSALSWSRLWFETPNYESHPPLYYSLLKLWRLLAGGEAGGMRGLSALAGVAATPVAALAAHELAELARPKRPMLLVTVAAALAALSPRLLVIGQDARPYALVAFSYALAILAWLRLSRSFRSDMEAGRWSDWALLGTGTLLVLWLHGIGLLYGGALFAALLLSATPEASRARWLRLTATVAAVAIAYLPCLLIIAGRSGDWTGGWLDWKPSAFPGAMLELFGLHHFDEMVTPTLALVVVPALLFLAVRSLLRSNQRALAWAMTLLMLAPPLAAALISQLGMPIFLARTQVAVLMPAYLLLAYALAVLPKRLSLAAGALLITLFGINLVQAIARPDLEPWREIAAILKREMAPGDVIWVYPNDVKLPLERAMGKAADIVPVPAPYPAIGVPGTHPTGFPSVVAIDGAAAHRWAARHAPAPGRTIWLLRGGIFYFDSKDKVLTELARGRRQAPPRKWLDLELRPLRPAALRKRTLTN